MKFIKLTLLTVILLLVLQLHAGQVTEAVAHRVAQNFLQKTTCATPPNLRMVYDFEPTAYVFSHESGFVIIAADNRLIPVLGYSNEGRFVIPGERDTLTGNNFWSWMKYWQDQLAYLSENNIPAAEEITLQWQNGLDGKIIRKTTTIVAPLLTTTWGQLWPYNSMCPADPGGSGGHVAAGCGPLAMAQIMKYHNYPEQGVGSYGYVSGSYPYSGANFGATTYKWDSMPDSISAINNHVATFIYHTGVSVKAEWSPGGTTSGASTIMMAFVNYFRMAYAPLKYVSRYAYNEAAWNSLLQNELLSNRPVYYQGFGTGGHAFVCDGVDAMNLYHFNWGWNGAYNGYFALNDLTPGSYNFTSGQGAIIGIGPNDGSTVVQDTTWFDTVTNLVNIAVPDAITLTLGAGSNIRFAANCRLKVWGRLVSVSTPLAYTKLTALNPADGWEGIDWHDDFDRMSDNDSSKLVFTQVEYSKSAAIDCISFGKVLVDHCRINNNYADQNFQYPGIRAQFKPVTIRNSEIYNNGAGAIAISYTGSLQAEISGNDIHHNTAPKGGGIMLSNAGSAIYGNSIHHNTGTSSGGGIYVIGNLPVITNNKIVNNFAGLQGGGIYLENSNARILNNLLANNSAGNGGYASGGAINCLINSSPTMIGNTIVNNYSLYGGGLNLGPDCYPLVKNCIVYGNQSTVGSQVALEDYTSDPVFDHCDIEGGVDGFGGWGSGGEYDTAYYTNNIDVVPQFISTSAGAGFTFDGLSAEWQLQSGSPCTDTGDSTGISSQIPALDLAGNARYNGIIDMGAYEFFAVPQNVTANSNTIPPGISVCLNATQTITVGGNGKSFLVQPGGTALMYAGTMISLLPGTAALSGSYVHCQITPTGPWCPGTAMPASAGDSSVASETGSSEIPDRENFKVFPNPTSGIFNLEFPITSGEVPAFVRCYNMQGACIFSKEFPAGSNFEVTLSGQPSGMYLVTVQIGHEMEMKKILKHPF